MGSRNVSSGQRRTWPTLKVEPEYHKDTEPDCYFVDSILPALALSYTPYLEILEISTQGHWIIPVPKGYYMPKLHTITVEPDSAYSPNSTSLDSILNIVRIAPCLLSLSGEQIWQSRPLSELKHDISRMKLYFLGSVFSDEAWFSLISSFPRIHTLSWVEEHEYPGSWELPTPNEIIQLLDNNRNLSKSLTELDLVFCRRQPSVGRIQTLDLEDEDLLVAFTRWENLQSLEIWSDGDLSMRELDAPDLEYVAKWFSEALPRSIRLLGLDVESTQAITLLAENWEHEEKPRCLLPNLKVVRMGIMPVSTVSPFEKAYVRAGVKDIKQEDEIYFG